MGYSLKAAEYFWSVGRPAIPVDGAKRKTRAADPMNDNASLYGLYVLFCWLAVNLVLILRGMRREFSLKELLAIVTLVSALFGIAASVVQLASI